MKDEVVGVEKAGPPARSQRCRDVSRISRSAIRQLVGNGQLCRVRLPGLSQAHGALDRFLLDKIDLDAVIERGKNRKES